MGLVIGVVLTLPGNNIIANIVADITEMIVAGGSWRNLHHVLGEEDLQGEDQDLPSTPTGKPS